MSNDTTPTTLLLKLNSLHTQILKKVDQQLGVHGISFTEFLVMSHLQSAANETMRRIDLAESIGLSASGVTRLLMPMEKIGLVKKEVNPRDARVSLVKLTKGGKKAFVNAALSVAHAAGELSNPLSAKQLTEFTKLTDTLLYK
ncbi:MAG: DNA-binding MarR family transcriptional regulator [Gammaproteobacteria bacterium]|jgi:DNA-binding MarR family transcriptional regulator